MDRDPLEQAELYRRFVSRSGLSDRTARIYARRVEQFAGFVAADPGQYGAALSDEHVRDYAVRDWRRRLLQVDKLSPATVQQHMTALGSFYDWLTLGKPRGAGVDVPKPDRHGLSEDDLRKVMRAAKASGERDYALLATMAYAGLRVGEAHALDVDDVAVTARTGQMQVRYGKGGKPRKLPLNGALRAAIKDWLDVRPGVQHEGPLWLTRSGDRMATRTIQHTVTTLSAAAGVAATAHTLRHTFVRRMMDSGVPMPDVQKLAGHRSPSTTAGYGNATMEDLERAVEHTAVDL